MAEYSQYRTGQRKLWEVLITSTILLLVCKILVKYPGVSSRHREWGFPMQLGKLIAELLMTFSGNEFAANSDLSKTSAFIL